MESNFKELMLETPRFAYIGEIKVSNFFSLENLHISSLEKRKEIYFLGENGDGKTLILMSLVWGFKKNFIQNIGEKKEVGQILDLIEANKELNVAGKDDSGTKYEFPIDDKGIVDIHSHLKNLLAYGVHRSRSDSEKASKYGFMTLFDAGQYLISPERWLMGLYTKELEKETGKKAPGTPSISLDAAKKILSDLVDKNVEIEVDSSGVRYIERGTQMQFSQLSEGYKSVITWMCDMVARLSENQPEVTKIQDLQGVVLVDEINLHLHPRWEKQIVKKLRGWFPKVQFFFTTHSPVTILGASDDAVFYRVYKEDGLTKISEPYFKESLKDLMANSVLTSPLFGLEDARMNGKAASSPTLDTSDDYLHSRIHQKISKRLEEKKKAGKVYFSEEEIDAMIEQALDEELS
jgi:hypothetical protein